MKEYRKVWMHFQFKYTIEQIAETIELIEQTKEEPTPDEMYGHEIWQKWQEFLQ